MRTPPQRTRPAPSGSKPLSRKNSNCSGSLKPRVGPSRNQRKRLTEAHEHHLPRLSIEMTAIFISHSSVDNAAAAEMKAWLELQGHTSLFLDFDPEAGIKGGSGWEQTLYQQLRQCQAVIALLTLSWLASKWCFAELVPGAGARQGDLPGRGADLRGGRGLRRHSAHRPHRRARGRLSPAQDRSPGTGTRSAGCVRLGSQTATRIRASWPFRKRTRRSSSGVARRSSRRSKPGRATPPGA